MAMFMVPYTNLHELNLDWIIEQLNAQGSVLSVNDKHGIVVLTGADLARSTTNPETVADALTIQGSNIQTVRTQIGTTELPTIAQTITGAIAENAGEIANIQDDVIGSTPLPTTAQTLTGAISELNGKMMTDKIITRTPAITHNFSFQNNSTNIIVVDGLDGTRQYMALVHNETNSLTIYEIAAGENVTTIHSGPTLGVTFNESTACTARIINVSGSSIVS